MRVRLIALDLDKTLLHNDGTISNHSLKILSECRKKEILIAIATSRSEFSAKKYVDLIKPDIVITSGGAIAYSGEKVLHKALITQVTANLIIQDALRKPSIECIRVMGEIHELSNNKNVPEGQKDYGHYDFSDFLEPLEENAWKIQFVTKDISFLETLTMRYPECELTSYTNEDLHKLADIKANKRDAIMSVCSSYGIKLEAVAAFGDDFSDYNLLKDVGIGVAVENAIEQVKSIANYICRSNEEDGVARFIEEFILR